MGDEPNGNEPKYTDEQLAEFGEFLDNVGPGWLEKWLEKNKDKFTAKPTEPKTQEPIPEGLSGFLQKALDKSEASLANLSETLEDALDMLTPEQRAALRTKRAERKSPRKEGGQQTPSEPPAQKPKDDPKPRGLGFLKRL